MPGPVANRERPGDGLTAASFERFGKSGAPVIFVARIEEKQQLVVPATRLRLQANRRLIELFEAEIRG